MKVLKITFETGTWCLTLPQICRTLALDTYTNTEVFSFLQVAVMHQAPHVPPMLLLVQLSPVLCQSLLQHWLVLWYTTVL